MDARFTEEDEAFRREIATWLDENLSGEFEVVRGRGGPGDEHSLVEERKAWEKAGRQRLIGIGKEVGGRDLSLTQQMIFYEEYARAGGPGRMGHIGEGLLAPTVIHFGTDDQKKRFLPGILDERDLVSGLPEPGAGSIWRACRPGPSSTATNGS